jgi:hypothetical protein
MNKIIATRIYRLVQHDPAKIAILNLLADGEWHTRFEVESQAKTHRETIGIVGICVIFKAIKDIDDDLLEIYENKSDRFYRVNPNRVKMIRKVVQTLQKHSKITAKDSSSSQEYRRFRKILRENQQKKKLGLDEADIKQFL